MIFNVYDLQGFFIQLLYYKHIKKICRKIRLIPTTEGGLLSTETMSLSRSSKKLRFFQTGAFLFYLLFYIFFVYYVQRANRMPAATAEPITPATFGPIACIKRKF